LQKEGGTLEREEVFTLTKPGKKPKGEKPHWRGVRGGKSGFVGKVWGKLDNGGVSVLDGFGWGGVLAGEGKRGLGRGMGRGREQVGRITWGGGGGGVNSPMGGGGGGGGP